MRLQLFTTALVLALGACAGDSDGSQDTGSGATDTSGDDDGQTQNPSLDTADDSGSSTSVSGSSSSGDATSTSSGPDDSSGSTVADESSSSTTEPVAFALFSTAFEEGSGIPPIHHVSGGNESPPLNWEGTPAGAMSLAIFLYDISIDFEHSAIWNIPPEVTELPQDVDQVAEPPDVPGALQCRSWIDEFGYGGPGSAANFYEFTIYAIDVETIPEIDQNSQLDDVRAAFQAHAIATATLTGQSTGPN